MIEKLAQLGLKNITIARILNIDDSTLARNYEKNLDKGRKNLINDIAAKQIELGLTGNDGEGNAIMLIWLGKQYLGQQERRTEKDIEEIRIKRIVIEERD